MIQYTDRIQLQEMAITFPVTN